MKTKYKILGGLWMLICALFSLRIAFWTFFYYVLGPGWLCIGIFFALLYFAGTVAGFCLLIGARWARPVVGVVALLTMAAPLVRELIDPNSFGRFPYFDGLDYWFLGTVFTIIAPVSAVALLFSNKSARFKVSCLLGLAMTLVLTAVFSNALNPYRLPDRYFDLYEGFFGQDYKSYERSFILPNVVSFGVSVALSVAFLRWWNKRQNTGEIETSGARDKYLGFFSWLSVAAPFIAYALCALVYTEVCPWYWWTSEIIGRYQTEDLTLFCGFLVAAIVGVLVLCADIGFKRWRLMRLPLIGLGFCFCLFLLACLFLERLSGTEG